MAKIPEDIQTRITELSKATEIPIKSLMTRLKEIITTHPTAVTMENVDFKIRFAAAVLIREHSMSGKTVDCIVQPIITPRAREITIKGKKTYVGDLTALVQLLTKNEKDEVVKGPITYAAGTFWRDGAKNIDSLIPGKTYKSSLQVIENDWGITISSDNAGFIETKDKLMDFEDFYKKEIEPTDINITLGEMDLNKSATSTDIKVITATVIEATVAESSEGNEYGRYNIMDDTVIGSNFAIFVDPKDVCWMQGSILKFGGTISINDKTGEVRWNTQFILPTEISLKREISIKPVTEKKETVDIDLEETEGKEEVKEEKDGVFEI